MPAKRQREQRVEGVRRARDALRRQEGRWLRGTALRGIREEDLTPDVLRGVLTNADYPWINRVQRQPAAAAAADVGSDTDEETSPPRQRRREEEDASVVPAARAAADYSPDVVPAARAAADYPAEDVSSPTLFPDLSSPFSPVLPEPEPTIAPPPPGITLPGIIIPHPPSSLPPGIPVNPADLSTIISMRTLLRAFDATGVFTNGGRTVNLARYKRLWRSANVNIHALLPAGTAEEYEILHYIWLLKIGGAGRHDWLMRYDKATDALFIPLPHVYNLRRNLFLYLLHFLSKLDVGNHTVFTSTAGAMSPTTVIGRITIPSDHVIPFSDVMNLWIPIVTTFRNYLADEWTASDDRWLDDESGEVILVKEARVVTFRLSNRPGFVVELGSKWEEGMDKVLDQVFPQGGIVTVKNSLDNQCLVYSIVIGLCRLENGRFFPRDAKYMEMSTLFARVDSSMSTSWQVQEAKRLLERVRCRQPGDIFSKIDDSMTQQLTTREACERFREIEDALVDRRTCLDVYVLRVSSSGVKRIYPCYLSERKIEGDEHRIKVLNISVDKFTHFCLITFLKQVFKQTGGKVFEVCSGCHQAFYSRSMFQKHKCDARDSRTEFKWSDRFTPEDWPFAVANCPKCHLIFVDQQAADYHKEHCFMKHRSGSRFVRLSDEPFLKLGNSDEKDDEAHMLGKRKLFFADFESCIREGDGVHEVMSYGLYDTTENKYYTGYSIKEFMDTIVSLSKKHKEMHVMFHNAMMYDANFILRYVLETYKDWSINVIMKSSSRLQSLKFLYQDGKVKRRIRIGDTYSFIGLSLERIVNSVRQSNWTDNEQVFPRFFEEFKKKYPDLSEETIDKVLYKNLFPYKFFTEPSRLDTPIADFERIFRPSEPNLEYFSESVTVEQLEENYPKFLEICELFNVKTARDYHDIYLLCDVMEITDVFLKARESIHETHKIDICKYIGMPGATWAAFWKLNPDLSLPLYSDTRMAEFIAHNTRGGVTSAVTRYAQSDETHSIIYFDVNGLYPYVMQKYKYPCGKLEWINLETVSQSHDPQDYFMNVMVPELKREGKGCYIAVDLEFPPEVKKATAQFPFAPNHEILYDCYYDEKGEMYPFLKRWSEMNNGEKMKPFRGLVGTLKKKIEYGVHWKLLKWYVKHGARITRLYHGLKFDEGDYLKDYVQLNIHLRNNVSDEMRKLVYKLLGNALYGKTFEDPFNRCVYLIVRNDEKLTGLLEEGFVKEIIPIDEHNCIVKLDGETVVLDKPTYIGACVTEYAKLHMYKLFYDKLLKMFPTMELIYTDTDSFIIRVEHEPGLSPKDLFAKIERECPGLVGKLGGQIKSETGTDDLIREVIALRSKVYIFITMKGLLINKCKGVTMAAQKNQLHWEDYKQCLLTLQAVPTVNYQIKRSAFGVRSCVVKKIGLAANDGKRKILEDNIHTVPWDDDDTMTDNVIVPHEDDDMDDDDMDDMDDDDDIEEVEIGCSKPFGCELL